MAHAHCMLDTSDYRHTLRICNTYCFSTATMVTRKLFNVTLFCHYLQFLVYPSKPCTQLSSSPHQPHAPPVSFNPSEVFPVLKPCTQFTVQPSIFWSVLMLSPLPTPICLKRSLLLWPFVITVNIKDEIPAGLK